MNKADLIKLLGETELAPEALEEIAAVLEKHRGTIHDSAMRQVEGANNTPTENQLREILAAVSGVRSSKRLGLIRQIIAEKGLNQLFTSTTEDAEHTIAFLTDQSGNTWALPIDDTASYLPQKMYDWNGDRSSTYKEVVRFCRGKFVGENFQVEQPGLLR